MVAGVIYVRKYNRMHAVCEEQAFEVVLHKGAGFDMGLQEGVQLLAASAGTESSVCEQLHERIRWMAFKQRRSQHTLVLEVLKNAFMDDGNQVSEEMPRVEEVPGEAR